MPAEAQKYFALGWTELFTPDAPLGLAGWYHLVSFGILIPFLVIRSKGRILEIDPLPPRKWHFRSVTIRLAFLGLFSLLVAYKSGIALFPYRVPRLIDLVAGATFLAIALPLIRPYWRRAVLARNRRIYFIAPSDRIERIQWIILSVMAGVTEEITWRGVQFGLLSALLSSPLAAAAVCAIMFGVAHADQGWRSVGIITVIAAAMHALVFLSGALYVAMAVHAIYDAVAGLTYSKLCDELGYEPVLPPSSLRPSAIPAEAPEAEPVTAES